MQKRVQQLILKAEQYLLPIQNSDGSWGGNRNVPGTIEETALAISALQKKRISGEQKVRFYMVGRIL